MNSFIFIKKTKLDSLPRMIGVYALKSKKDLLYIGKAANIRNRVLQHFSQLTMRDNLFIDKVEKIGYVKTNSEIEALILESQLIKKYQPKFNVVWRDDKNYFYVAFTQNEQKIPYVFITHQLQTINYKLQTNYIGPFTDGKALKKTLQLLRKTFPYYSSKNHSEKLCTYCHLGLCPGPNPNPIEYKKNINNLIAVLEGKKQKVLKNLKKEMQNFSKQRDFEKAAKVRDKLFALQKIISNARIFEKQNALTFGWKKTNRFLQSLLKTNKTIKRIEGYDVSNIQGKQATASMVVFADGKPNKDQYRKFKIKIEGKPNDTAMIKEALQRRFLHHEWQRPDLILIDGGKPQLSAAVSSIKSDTLIVALAKRNNELYIKGKKKPYLLANMPREIFNLILQVRDESHRFAIAYHKKLREKELLT